MPLSREFRRGPTSAAAPRSIAFDNAGRGPRQFSGTKEADDDDDDARGSSLTDRAASDRSPDPTNETPPKTRAAPAVARWGHPLPGVAGMPDLLMPSEVKKAADADRAAAAAPAADPAAPGRAAPVVVEPPSAKLLVRLFLIPLLIVSAAVGVMFLVGLLTGGTPSFQDALTGLKEPGGERTGGMLVGPGAKQRYMYAKALADQMKEKMQAGMSEADRAKLATDLMEVVDKARPDEGDVKHFLLLA